MRGTIASLFRLLFLCKPLRYFYYGLYEKIFLPKRLFKGVTKTILYQGRFTMMLDIEDWIAQNLYFLGHYEEKETRFLQKVLKTGDTFIDVGANIGIFSLVASAAVGSSGKVYSFEPFAPNYKSLQNHVSLNHLENVVTEKLALSDRQTDLRLSLDEKDSNRGMATAYAPTFTSAEVVQALPLDAYVQENNITGITMIKIDIEGGEYPALMGMQGILQKYHPVILIEINPEILQQTSSTAADIEALLHRFSYKKMFLDNSGTLVDRPLKNDHSCNYVFV